jgi:hypothetical protein
MTGHTLRVVFTCGLVAAVLWQPSPGRAQSGEASARIPKSSLTLIPRKSQSAPLCKGWFPAARRHRYTVSFSGPAARVASFAELFAPATQLISGAAPAPPISPALLIDICDNTFDCGSAPRCDPYTECDVNHYVCEVNPRTGFADCRYAGFCGSCQGL